MKLAATNRTVEVVNFMIDGVLPEGDRASVLSPLMISLPGRWRKRDGAQPAAAPWVGLAVGIGSELLPSATADLLAHLRRTVPAVPVTPDEGTRIRAVVGSRSDADLVAAGLRDWAAGAEDGWTLTVTGSGLPAGEWTRFSQLRGSFAAENLAWAVSEAAGVGG
ncbi:hypothetical protein GA0070622_3420 [Micromonospora sediminicola]|uniref:Uncharacterized protein n=1 Tax=Micromonospora sediminicola TaxID=946078 RepID=A0A1A9BA58_9ACTN|nr:hypothetical protein GA0070622_3420 [Micromonospora sediminicola]